MEVKLETLGTIKVEDINKELGYIKAHEKLIGENDKGITPVLGRPLRNFVTIFKQYMTVISSAIEKMDIKVLITQERVNELMNVTNKTCKETK